MQSMRVALWYVRVVVADGQSGSGHHQPRGMRTSVIDRAGDQPIFERDCSRISGKFHRNVRDVTVNELYLFTSAEVPRRYRKRKPSAVRNQTRLLGCRGVSGRTDDRRV